MPVTFRPAFCRLRIACSRPAPGPFTFTSTSTMPLLRAVWAAFSAARPAANGVLLRAPLNPTVPADAHEIVSPFVSVIVTIVLLNVALMCATPRVTPLRIFFFAAPGLPAAVFAASAMGLVSFADLPDYAVPAVNQKLVAWSRRLNGAEGDGLIRRLPATTCRVPSRPSYRRRSCADPCGCGRSSGCAGRGRAARGGGGCHASYRCRGAGRCSAGCYD